MSEQVMSEQVQTNDGVITCDACPVLCRIRPGKTGACDRYGNVEGTLTRMDPLVVTQQIADEKGELVPFLPNSEEHESSQAQKNSSQSGMTPELKGERWKMKSITKIQKIQDKR